MASIIYYSVSAFGKNTSLHWVRYPIRRFDPASRDFKWVDYGKVIQSVPGRDMWNAIDPNLAVDENNTPWLVSRFLLEWAKTGKATHRPAFYSTA